MFVRQSFRVQRDERIDAAGAARGNPAGEGYAERKDDGGAEPDQRIARWHIWPFMPQKAKAGPGAECTRQETETE